MHAISVAKGFVGKIRGWYKRLTDGTGWYPMMGRMVRNNVSAARGWINNKIPGPGPLPSLFDTGGPLYPGSTLAINTTGKTETVFTNDDVVSMVRSLSAAAVALRDLSGQGGGTPALVDKLTLIGKPDEFPALLRDVTHELRVIRQGGVHAKRAP
jgi:hypothetical protein